MTVNIACQLWLYDTQCLSELNDANSSFPRKDINLFLDTHTHTITRLIFPSLDTLYTVSIHIGEQKRPISHQ